VNVAGRPAGLVPLFFSLKSEAAREEVSEDAEPHHH
jgi:hypothetical protein